MKFLTEILRKEHKKNAFSSGKSLLDNYLRKQAGQDMKRKLAACFVLSDSENLTVKGYYTLSNSSISLEKLPEEMRNKLPFSYQAIPVTLLGRLAVDTHYQGQKIGVHLLLDALRRSYEASKSIGSYAVLVDPIDDAAREFYRKYDFVEFVDDKKMFLKMSKIKLLFEE